MKDSRTVRSAQRPHRLRRLLPYLGAVLLVALIGLGLRPRPVRVETVQVSTGPLRATVTEEGKTRIRHRYTVAAPVPGQLRRIELTPGDAVQAGQSLVAVIEPVVPALLDARSRQLAEARRETALANRAKTQAAYKFATAELARVGRLHKDGAAAFRDLEAAQANEAVAGKEVAAAESALLQAEAELANFTSLTGTNSVASLVEVRAPASGKVLRVFEESARVVAMGTPLLEVGDTADLEIVIEVLSRDGAAIVAGTRIDLEQWGNGKTLEAVVRLIEPQAFTKISALGVEEQRVRVIADLVTPVADRPGLGDQFRVEARIIVWETPRTLKVPAGALFRRGNQWCAFVLAAGRAGLRPVSVGRSSDTEMQVLDGLREGETVILYPGDRIREGAVVEPIKVTG